MSRYSEDDPMNPIETIRGTYEEVTTWAHGKGTDVDIQVPTPEALEMNRRMQRREAGE